MKTGFCTNCPFNNIKRPISPWFLELIDEQSHVHACHVEVKGTGNDPNVIRAIPQNDNEICYGHLTYREKEIDVDRWENEGGSCRNKPLPWRDIDTDDYINMWKHGRLNHEQV